MTPDIPTSGQTFEALVNGEPYPLDAPLPVDDLVAALVPGFAADRTARGIAVAVNDAVVPRSAWAGVLVGRGDRVEVVGAVQGG
jgi:sulfur carrier protein